jgi:hypothetical protein
VTPLTINIRTAKTLASRRDTADAACTRPTRSSNKLSDARRLLRCMSLPMALSEASTGTVNLRERGEADAGRATAPRLGPCGRWHLEPSLAHRYVEAWNSKESQ